MVKEKWKKSTGENMNINLEQINDFWKKYNIIICVILLIYAGYKTFSPHKIIEERTIIDIEAVNKVQKEVNRLTQINKSLEKQIAKSKETSRNVLTDEVLIETIYPDGKIERRIEKKVRNTVTIVETSSTSVVSTVSRVDSSSETYISDSSSKTHIDASKKTIINPMPFWSTGVVYQYNLKECSLFQGINIGNSITVGVIGSWRFDMDMIEEKKSDLGGILIIRY